MLDLRGIKKTLEKLDDSDGPGRVESREGRNHSRYSYVLGGTLVFSFGVTRSSKSKSIAFDYVPRQMGLKRMEYRDLHDCPMSKEQYNQKMKESGKA